MNAVRHLLKEHEEVYKLFNQFIEAGEKAYQEKHTIAEKLIEKITENAEHEEKVLFPAFEEKGGEDTEEMVLEGIEEHHVIEFIMNSIKKTQPEEKTFDAKIKVLLEISKHHFLEEEREVFPKAKKVLKGELDHLGEEMEALEKIMKK